MEHGWKALTVDNGHLIIGDPAGLLVKCRTSRGLDIGHLREIFLTKEYGEEIGNVVVDVGMSNGDSSIFFVSRGSNRVVGLDPSPESFALAKQNIKMNAFESKISPVNIALDFASSKANFEFDHSNPNGACLASTSKTKSDSSEFMLEVETISLEDLMKLYHLHTIDLLKLDCEGAEYNIINSLSSETFDKIKEIILEFHSGEQNLCVILARNGFKIRLEGDRNGRGYVYARKIQEIDQPVSPRNEIALVKT